MRRAFLLILAALFVAAPIELSARQVVKHHAAKAQARSANPNCALGTTSVPSGTVCLQNDLTPGGALTSTDTVMLCQKAGGCFGTDPAINNTSVQLPSYIRSSLSAVPPLGYNPSTGAFSCSLFAGSASGCVPSSSGGTANYLRADGTWATPPTASGSGVNSGTLNQLAYYGATGAVVSGLTTGSNGQVLTLSGGVPTWAAATGGTGGAGPVWTGTVTGGNAYVSTPATAHATNTAYDFFCGTFATASTTGTAPTLQVGTAAALPINVQSGGGATTAAGAGDIPGGNTSLCLQLNSAASAWVKTTLVPGKVYRDQSVTVSAVDWATGALYVYTTGTPTLTFPAVAGNLSGQGGVTIAALVPVTLQPNAADGINGNAVGATFLNSGVAMVNSDGAGGTTNSLTVTGGTSHVFPFSWGPGQNLSTAAIPLVTRGQPTDLVTIACTVGGAAPASSFIDICYAPNGTVPTPNTACTGATKVTTTHCDASLTPGQQQGGLGGGVTIPAGNHLWVVGNGSGWGGTITGISGKIQITEAP